MDYSKVLTELENEFGIRENEMLILKALVDNEMTADQICKEAGIPKGRVYDFINRLVKLRLIRKIGSKPALYSGKDFNINLLHFLDYCKEDEKRKEAEVRALLEEHGDDIEVELIKTREEHIHYSNKIFLEGDWFSILEREDTVPIFLYPKSDEEFLKIRKAMARRRPLLLGFGHGIIPFKEVMNRAYTSGKHFRHVIERRSMDNFINDMVYSLGKKRTIDRLLHILAGLKKFNVKIKLIEGTFPYQMTMSDKAVYFSLKPTKKRKLPLGLVITEREIMDDYLKFFDDVYASAAPIEPYIEEQLKKLGHEEKI